MSPDFPIETLRILRLPRQFQLGLPEPAQAALLLLVDGGETRPPVAAHEQQQERKREEIAGFDGEDNHRHEIQTRQDFGPVAFSNLSKRCENADLCLWELKCSKSGPSSQDESKNFRAA